MRAVSRTGLPDHLIGAQQDRLRDGQSEGLRGPQVHYEFEFCRLLDGQITGPGPLEDLVNVARVVADASREALSSSWTVR